MNNLENLINKAFDDKESINNNTTGEIREAVNNTLDQLDTTYHAIKQIITPNSFTFDDSSIRDSDLTGVNATPDFSMTIETMDNEIFTRKITDSSF